MIAMEGEEPIGVLIGAKRPDATLVHRIAVRPDRLRRGHGRHLLASLGAKLAILGPPRLVAEVPDDLPGAVAFFEACGFAREAAFRDYAAPSPAAAGPGDLPAGTLVIPATVADLDANAALAEDPGACWERHPATLRAREDLLEGCALVTDERIAGHTLFRRSADGVGTILAAFRAPDLGAARALLGAVAARAGAPLLYPKVHPGEMPEDWIAPLGLVPGASCTRLAATARAS